MTRWCAAASGVAGGARSARPGLERIANLGKELDGRVLALHQDSKGGRRQPRDPAPLFVRDDYLQIEQLDLDRLGERVDRFSELSFALRSSTTRSQARAQEIARVAITHWMGVAVVGRAMLGLRLLQA